MKISSDRNSPHYSTERFRVYLEGSERTNIVFADEEGRHAISHRLDSEGNVKFDKNGNALTDEFWGHVRIEPMLMEDSQVALVYDPENGFGSGISCVNVDMNVESVKGVWIKQETDYSTTPPTQFKRVPADTILAGGVDAGAAIGDMTSVSLATGGIFDGSLGGAISASFTYADPNGLGVVGAGCGGILRTGAAWDHVKVSDASDYMQGFISGHLVMLRRREAEVHINSDSAGATFLRDRLYDELPFSFTDDTGAVMNMKVVEMSQDFRSYTHTFKLMEVDQEPHAGLSRINWDWRDTADMKVTGRIEAHFPDPNGRIRDAMSDNMRDVIKAHITQDVADLVNAFRREHLCEYTTPPQKVIPRNVWPFPVAKRVSPPTPAENDLWPFPPKKEQL